MLERNHISPVQLGHRLWGLNFIHYFLRVQDRLEDLEAHGSFASYFAVDFTHKYMSVYFVSIECMDTIQH